MPEFPDVEVFRRRVESEALGRRISKARIDAPRMLVDVSASTLARDLRGCRLTAAVRHGKHLLLEVEPTKRWLHLHFGMTGEVLVRTADEEDPPYVRLGLEFEDGGRLSVTSRRRLGKIGWAKHPERFVEETGLGPDPWNDRVDLRAFRGLLEGRRGTIKSTLMDQTLLAGIGNVYADEILFQAGVNPSVSAARVDPRSVSALHKAMKRVLEKAVGYQADPARMPARWLLPHRRSGAECPRCDGTIVKTEVAGRSTYHCDSHQTDDG